MIVLYSLKPPLRSQNAATLHKKSNQQGNKYKHSVDHTGFKQPNNHLTACFCCLLGHHLNVAVFPDLRDVFVSAMLSWLTALMAGAMKMKPNCNKPFVIKANIIHTQPYSQIYAPLMTLKPWMSQVTGVEIQNPNWRCNMLLATYKHLNHAFKDMFNNADLLISSVCASKHKLIFKWRC